jgi:hypothetical protein
MYKYSLYLSFYLLIISNLCSCPKPKTLQTPLWKNDQEYNSRQEVVHRSSRPCTLMKRLVLGRRIWGLWSLSFSSRSLISFVFFQSDQFRFLPHPVKDSVGLISLKSRQKGSPFPSTYLHGPSYPSHTSPSRHFVCRPSARNTRESLEAKLSEPWTSTWTGTNFVHLVQNKFESWCPCCPPLDKYICPGSFYNRRILSKFIFVFF